MTCNVCSELCGSVILGEHFEGKYKELKMHQVCEHCHSSNIALWINLECPKCHGIMVKEEHIGYTDG
jgi:Zn finger protein HypA/HybF involved in hydrogenase expression